MKKIIEGWIAKDETLEDVYVGSYGDEVTIMGIWKDRANMEMWTEDGWPPKKVRITIEVEGVDE